MFHSRMNSIIRALQIAGETMRELVSTSGKIHC